MSLKAKIHLNSLKDIKPKSFSILSHIRINFSKFFKKIKKTSLLLFRSSLNFVIAAHILSNKSKTLIYLVNHELVKTVLFIFIYHYYKFFLTICRTESVNIP